MPDVFSRKKRSWIMARISGCNTKPEMIVRKILYKMGYRYRLHDKKLPGTPDIVLTRHQKVVFVHGCFWHGHKVCRKGVLPSSNKAFWAEKIAKNQERDRRAVRLLRKTGWRLLVVWECTTGDIEKLGARLNRFLKTKRS
ncbi:MAG: very short patch repair endonuclease [Nitrospirota bacterium]|nr:very short patch repair endonuclease [Nitrospirota bacterium]